LLIQVTGGITFLLVTYPSIIRIKELIFVGSTAEVYIDSD